MERCIFDDRFIRDNHAGGVGPDVPGDPFHFGRDFDEFLIAGVGVRGLAELDDFVHAVPQRNRVAAPGHFDSGWDELAELIDFLKRDS